jgi:inorganic pyrophosphatase/exopolyphosphatase
VSSRGDLLERAIGRPLIDGGAYVDGLMSRKKQLVPPLESGFAKIPGPPHAA